MSGNFNGPLSELAQHVAHHGQLPPPQKSQARTTYGSLLLVGCGYVAFTLGPDAINEYPPAWLYGFAAVCGLGLLLFVNGMRGPRLPAEFMTKFWALFFAAAFGAGSYYLAVYLPDWWANFWVRGFCVTFTVAQALDFLLLLLRPVNSNAEGMVRQQIERNRIDMRPANGRRR